MSEPTASPPQSSSRGESPGCDGGVNPEGPRACRRGTRGGRSWASEETKEWCRWRWGRDREPNLPPLSPPSRHPPRPGLFPRKLYQCGHARRRHLGRLVSRCRARKRVFPAWPLAAAEPLVALPPACGGSGRLPASPSGACGAPRTGGFLLLGHNIPRRRSAPSLRTPTPPPSSFPHTSALGGGGGGMGRSGGAVFWSL